MGTTFGISGAINNEEADRRNAARYATQATGSTASAPVSSQVPSTIFSDSDILRNAGRFRAQADKSANAQVAGVSARTGGDTSSPLFSFLASSIRGGAAADYGTMLLKARQDAALANAGQGNEAAGLANQVAGLAENSRSNRASEASSAASLAESRRQFDTNAATTAENTAFQQKLATVGAADNLNVNNPLGSQLAGLLDLGPGTTGYESGERAGFSRRSGRASGYQF